MRPLRASRIIGFIVAKSRKDPPPPQAMPQVASCGTRNCLLVVHFAQFRPLRQLTLPASPTGRGRVPCPPPLKAGLRLHQIYCSILRLL